MTRTGYIDWTTGQNLYAKPRPLDNDAWGDDDIAGVETGSLGEYAFAGLDESKAYAVFLRAGANPSSSDTVIGYLGSTQLTEMSSGLVELVANAVRTELTPELATISSIGEAASYTNTDAEIRYITRGDAYDGTANPVLSWTVAKDYTSGWTGTMTITHRVTGATMMTATVTAASATQLTASLTTTNTAFAALVSDEEFGPHPYDVQMVNGSSEITAIPNGIAIIRKDRSTS